MTPSCPGSFVLGVLVVEGLCHGSSWLSPLVAIVDKSEFFPEGSEELRVRLLDCFPIFSGL